MTKVVWLKLPAWRLDCFASARNDGNLVVTTYQPDIFTPICPRNDGNLVVQTLKVPRLCEERSDVAIQFFTLSRREMEFTPAETSSA